MSQNDITVHNGNSFHGICKEEDGCNNVQSITGSCPGVLFLSFFHCVHSCMSGI